MTEQMKNLGAVRRDFGRQVRDRSVFEELRPRRQWRHLATGMIVEAGSSYGEMHIVSWVPERGKHSPTLDLRVLEVNAWSVYSGFLAQFDLTADLDPAVV